jgi:hypothetical protein
MPIKNIHRALLVGALTTTILGGGLFAVTASAATPSSEDDSLASKIATKFNLNKEDVQTVVKDYRTEQHANHQAEHQKRLEDRLTQAVKDGKISEEQKSKIINYMKSQESFFESLRDKTEEERHTAMETHKAEVKKWASDNGIDLQYVMPGGPGGERGPMGGPRHRD